MDPQGRESTATVLVDVDVNHKPVTMPDDFTGHAGQPVPAPVLANDSDPENDPLTIVGYSSSNFGCGDGRGRSPPADAEYPYEETFTYDVTDNHGHTVTESVHVLVNANRRPDGRRRRCQGQDRPRGPVRRALERR